MSLNADWSGVQDFEALHEDQNEYGKTEALVFATMALGMPQITEANWTEFWSRLKVADIYMTGTDQDGNTVPYIQPEDVRRRVGLRTNAQTETLHAWVTRLFKQRVKDEMWQVKNGASA